MISAGRFSDRFERHYGKTSAGIWAAPGRVNLIGEHTDYNEGFVLPIAIDRQTRVTVAPRMDRTIRVASTFGADDAGQETVTAEVDNISKDTVGGWSAYPLGVVWALNRAGANVSGFDMLIDSNVPIGAGLSSSAAIESSVALALNDLFRAGLSRAQLVQIGQQAENDVVGAPTGIMDQSASLLGSAGSAVFLDCRTTQAELVPFDVAGSGLVLLVIDTKVSHSHASGAYASRRASCEVGAKKLQVAALRDVSVGDLTEAAAVLDEETFRRVRHIVTENNRVLDTVDRLKTSGPESIGELLDASHRSMRDDFEISCPELDLAVDTARFHGALGARMTGGGFGGSAIALVPEALAATIETELEAAFASATFQKPDIFTVQPDEGARRLL